LTSAATSKPTSFVCASNYGSNNALMTSASVNFVCTLCATSLTGATLSNLAPAYANGATT